MSKIRKMFAWEILDSRGNPTVAVKVETEKTSAMAMVPSGASTGKHEALELRDNDPKRYLGKGVLKACHNVNTVIAKVLTSQKVEEQARLDQLMLELDGTTNKKRLGANAILGVSLACARAAAKEMHVGLYRYLNPKSNLLPMPMMNILNGGRHADSGLDIQEIMIVPIGAPSFREAARMGSEVFHILGRILKNNKYHTAVGDEGGYAPLFSDQEMAFDYCLEAIEKAGYHAGKDICFAIDAAASEFFELEAQIYKFKIKNKKERLSAIEMIDYWEKLIKKYPIVSLEDGLAEDDWKGWKMLQKRLGKKVQVVGDDLLVTNPQRLKKAIDVAAANSILIKLNQIGTLTETIKTVKMAQKVNWKTVVSHRSGETEDTTIADLAVGLGTGQIKTGSLCRSERIAKYNRLIFIEKELGTKAKLFRPNFKDMLKNSAAFHDDEFMAKTIIPH